MEERATRDNLTDIVSIPEEICDTDMGSGGNYSKGCLSAGKQLKRKNEELSSERKRLRWLDMNLEAEFRPDSVAHYANKFSYGRGSQSSSKNEVSKHLVYLGWKIQSVIDEKGVTRMRYISPGGYAYYSLYQACLGLQRGKENERNKDNNQAASLIPPRMEVERQEKSTGLSKIGVERQEKSTCLSKIVREKDFVSFEKEYCPQAVIEYAELRKNNPKGRFKSGRRDEDLISKVKKHLSAVGWTFYLQDKNGGRKELRYQSPVGRKFISLVTACEWCVSEGDCSLLYPSSTEQVRGKAGLQFACFTGSSSSSPSVCMDGELSKMPKMKRGRPKMSRGRPNQASTKERNEVKAELFPPVLQTSKRVRQAAVSSTAYQNPRTFLSLLIDGDVVFPGAKVHYRGKNGLPMKEGKITRAGIECTCCQEVFTLSKFEAHAGSTFHSPSAHIFLEDGRSIFECHLQLKSENNVKNTKSEPHQVKKGNQHREAADDICSVCHDGGYLLVCDECPSSFHASCLDLKYIPHGDWFCSSCCCRICGTGRRKEDKEQFADDSSINCGQCEHRFHIGCLKSKGLVQPECHSNGNWFCNLRCQQIHSGLQKILGKPIPVGDDNLTWTLLKYKGVEVSDKDALENEHLMESYSKLNVALSIIHECFEPLKESRTGRDLVEDVIFSRWSELHRLNFHGFYTVVLERNDELITVCTVRIHGEKVAEIPLVATRFKYRRLGMCRILMDELEKKLMELGVEMLVLPAVPSVLTTWETAFGFSQMNASERQNFRDRVFLDFQGTIMCQKLLKKKNRVNLYDDNKVIFEAFQENRREKGEIVDLHIPAPANYSPEHLSKIDKYLSRWINYNN